MSDKRWADVPQEARAFWENATPSQIERLMAMDDLYRRNPEAWEWLSSRRADEIKTMDEGLDLVRSLRRTGRWMKWGFVTIVGIFFAMMQVGESVWKAIGWFKAGGH